MDRVGIPAANGFTDFVGQGERLRLRPLQNAREQKGAVARAFVEGPSGRAMGSDETEGPRQNRRLRCALSRGHGQLGVSGTQEWESEIHKGADFRN